MTKKDYVIIIKKHHVIDDDQLDKEALELVKRELDRDNACERQITEKSYVINNERIRQ